MRWCSHRYLRLRYVRSRPGRTTKVLINLTGWPSSYFFSRAPNQLSPTNLQNPLHTQHLLSLSWLLHKSLFSSELELEKEIHNPPHSSWPTTAPMTRMLSLGMFHASAELPLVSPRICPLRLCDCGSKLWVDTRHDATQS